MTQVFPYKKVQLKFYLKFELFTSAEKAFDNLPSKKTKKFVQ